MPALFTIDSTMVEHTCRRKPSRDVPRTAHASLLTFETPPNHLHSKRRDHPPDPRKLQNHQFPYEKYTFLDLRPVPMSPRCPRRSPKTSHGRLRNGRKSAQKASQIRPRRPSSTASRLPQVAENHEFPMRKLTFSLFNPPAPPLFNVDCVMALRGSRGNP